MNTACASVNRLCSPKSVCRRVIVWCDCVVCVWSNACESGRNTEFADANCASAHSVLLPLKQFKITQFDRVYVCILECVIVVGTPCVLMCKQHQHTGCCHVVIGLFTDGPGPYRYLTAHTQYPNRGHVTGRGSGTGREPKPEDYFVTL